MPPIVQGQIFPTLQDFKNALRDWAVERNWTPHILDSDSHRVRAGCRSSPSCPFRIRANYSVRRGDAKVTTCDDNHTCEPFRASHDVRAHQDIKRAETGKLKFLLEAVPKIMNVNLDTNVLDIITAVENRYGQKIPTRQAQKVKAGLTDRIKGPCRHCHQLGHTRRQCPQLRPPGPGTMSIPNMARDMSSFADNDGDDATYADGGLETDRQGNRALEPMHYANDQRPNNHNTIFTQAPPPQIPTQILHPTSNPASFNNVQPTEVPMDPILSNGMQRVRSREASSLEQNHIMPNPEPVTGPNACQNRQTPQEARLEAARLMQQAANLMQEAARMNAEAARLTAYAADS